MNARESKPRFGFTLIELLVIIVIVVKLLVSITSNTPVGYTHELHK